MKNIIGMKKSEVESLKKKTPRDNDVNELSLMQLKNYLSENYHKTMNLYKNIVEEHRKDPVTRINEMKISDQTKQNYQVEWRLYTKWLKENEMTISEDSANSYITAIVNNSKKTVKASTQRQKKMMLQILLQHIVDRNIKLDKFNMKISYGKKAALTDEQLKKYFDEQIEINMQDYLIQRLLYTYGLRIHSTALLKKKHLEFLDHNNTEHKIFLPDKKVGNDRLEKVDPELEQLLREFLPDTLDENEFIFYRNYYKKDPRRRAAFFGNQINKRLKNTKALVKNSNYKYTSHLFRKTKAYNLYHKKNQELKDEVRTAIGQSLGSTAVEFYIN